MKRGAHASNQVEGKPAASGTSSRSPPASCLRDYAACRYYGSDDRTVDLFLREDLTGWPDREAYAADRPGVRAY